MKKLFLFLLLAVASANMAHAQKNVGINTQNPDPSAALDISSTDKGVLIPRMSKGQRDAIPSPAAGLMIYQNDGDAGFYYFNGTTWEALSKSGGGGTGTGSSSIYGDGSAGALNITSDVDWTTSPPTSLNFQFSEITVASNATFKIPSGTKLRCNGNVIINGTINIEGAETIVGVVSAGWIGGIARTVAGSGETISYGVLTTSVTSLINIPVFGGGTGANGGVGSLNYGGEGGGSFAIYANGQININASGVVAANGGNGVTNAGTSGSSNGNGGGGGGIVVLLSKSGVNNAGTISATGGSGSDATLGNGPRPGGGGGGGGIVLLLGSTVSAGNVQVSGGATGNNLAMAGTGSSSGGAGGGSGGNGGAGGVVNVSQSKNINNPPAAGSPGIFRVFATPNPENLY